MNMIVVSVDCGPLLALTLSWNRHHFDQVMVVTAPRDGLTQSVAEQNRAGCYLTESFWDGGALFNKWKALEEGLDRLGRTGWLCVMDADVLWPKGGEAEEDDDNVWFGPEHDYAHVAKGQLCTPKRRMLLNVDLDRPPFKHTFTDRDRPGGDECECPGSLMLPFPQERHWGGLPLHPQQHEWAGYTQVFHAGDPVLGPPPWHQQDWTHAGGADSFFQAKWPQDRKVRPPFEVLHLGESGVNWGGIGNRDKVRALIRRRGQGPDRFRAEKIG